MQIYQATSVRDGIITFFCSAQPHDPITRPTGCACHPTTECPRGNERANWLNVTISSKNWQRGGEDMKGPLDGHNFDNKLMTYFCIPGRTFLWIRYMFPSGGLPGVAASGRQAGSLLLAILYSAIFYVLAAFFLIVAIFS